MGLRGMIIDDSRPACFSERKIQRRERELEGKRDVLSISCPDANEREREREIEGKIDVLPISYPVVNTLC